MAFTGHENNLVSFETGSKLTKKYRNEMNEGDIIASYYSRDSIEAILKQDKCVGIRAYFGRKTDGQLCLVIVGVDSEENDQIGTEHVCVDGGIDCSPYCSTQNLLNS